MKIVKILLILILSLFWAAISLVILHSTTSPYTPLTFLTLAYCSLVYLVWPLGTSYSEEAYKRFFIVLGSGIVILSLDVLINRECPIPPSNPFAKSTSIEALITLICIHLGKYPAFLFIFGLGCYTIYLGYTKNLSYRTSRTPKWGCLYGNLDNEYKQKSQSKRLAFTFNPHKLLTF